MLSIIICSISPERLAAVRQNFEETIGGIEFEFVAIDNRERRWPIAKVYNYGASQAKYPYLFFVHEDVLFYAKGWGAIITEKLGEPDCGVIGFAGCKVKLKAYSGWFVDRRWEHTHDCRRVGGLWIGFDLKNTLKQSFEETLVLDGLGMFVRKEVWKENRFDEHLLTGFHCYDIDFSLQIAHHYKNYVCCSPLILIEHASGGSYDSQWFADTLRMHQCKWNRFLPMMSGDIHVEEALLKKREESVFYAFVYSALRSKDFGEKKQLMIEFWKYPFSWRHFIHCFTCSMKYLRICCAKG